MTCCPSCGYNLTRDEVIEIGPWRLDPRGAVSFDGRRLSLTADCAMIMHSIAAAHGRPISLAALLSRIGSEALTNIIQVQIWRIRDVLRASDIPVPFHTVRSRGYAWGAAA
jgi:DNA-binding response OmpR family regulator